jgi:hypothetical protein
LGKILRINHDNRSWWALAAAPVHARQSLAAFLIDTHVATFVTGLPPEFEGYGERWYRRRYPVFFRRGIFSEHSSRPHIDGRATAILHG